MSFSPISGQALQPSRFTELFADVVEPETLESLIASAAKGGTASIDLLFQLALRNDASGTRAENALFDIFSGKMKHTAHLASRLEELSYRLYLTCSHGGAGGMNGAKFCSPSKLLYMAGGGNIDLDTKKEISRLLTGHQQAQSHHEHLEENDLWRPDRLLTTDEINARTKPLQQAHGPVSINFPVPLVEPHSQQNLLQCLLLERIASGLSFQPLDLFPINTGNHWILFGIYKNQPSSDKLQAFVFNSHDDLDRDSREKLRDAAHSVAAEDLIFLESNLQRHVPNGCGIFVSQAIISISEKQGENPVESLLGFVDEFSSLPIEKQELFNTEKRRQIYGCSLP